MAIRFKKALGPELSKIIGLEVSETDVDANYVEVDMIDYSVDPNEATSASQDVAGFEDPIVTIGAADPTGVTVNGPFVPGTAGYLLLEKVLRAKSSFFLRYSYRSQVILDYQALGSTKTFAVDTAGVVTLGGSAWTNTGTNSDPVKQQRNILSRGMAIEYRESDGATPSIYIIDRFTPASTEADPQVIVSNPPSSAIAAKNTHSLGLSIPQRRRKLQVRGVQDIGESGTVGELVSANISMVIDSDAGWEYLTGITT